MKKILYSDEVKCPKCGSKDIIKLNHWYQCLDCEANIIINIEEELKVKDKSLTSYLTAIIEDARKRNVSEEKLESYVIALEINKEKEKQNG